LLFFIDTQNMRALFYSKVNLDQIFQGLRMSCI
jgi:hypothetical protein